MARKPGLDLAQARRTRKLSEQQRQELALRRQTPHPMVGCVFIHKPVEHRPRNMLLKLVKNAILAPHDVDPLLVSRTPRKPETK
jgi:hypothetical protein